MLRKREGFEGQHAIVLPRKILSKYCSTNPLIEGAYITDIGYYPKAKYHYRKRLHGCDQDISHRPIYRMFLFFGEMNFPASTAGDIAINKIEIMNKSVFTVYFLI